MIQGTLKVTGLAMGEFSVNLLGTTVQMKAKAAFVDSRTGATHGWTEGNQWSHGTIEKMRELVLLMEADMARQHFESGGSTESPIDPTAKPGMSGGLGEHIGGDGEQV
jgi:hypothetical protein